MRILRSIALIASVSIAALVLFTFVFHYRYVESLQNRNRPEIALATSDNVAAEGMPLSLRHSLGMFSRDKAKASYFANFPPEKSPGTIRIGAFGGSTTVGKEVASDQDFPSLLAKLFRENGYKNVEVLNFGQSWYSSHQIFRLIEELGGKYSLDYILFGPTAFLPSWDLTFHHTGESHPYFLHGRYVLDGEDSTSFIDVVGKTDFEDRFANYFRFFPHWSYLRYDRRAPSAFQSVLPSGRELKNPFYYSDLSEVEETQLLGIRNFRRIAKMGPQIVFVEENSVGVSFDEKLPQENLISEPQPISREFYFRRFKHFSSAGNAELARFYFQILIGAKDIRLEKLSLTPVRPLPKKSILMTLDALGSVEIWTKDARVGHWTNSAHAFPDEPDPVLDFSKLQIRSLVAIKGCADGIASGLWLPLDFAIEDEMPVFIRSENSQEKIGQIQLISNGAALGCLESDLVKNWEAKSSHPGRRMDRLHTPNINASAGTTLIFGDRIVGQFAAQADLRDLVFLPQAQFWGRLVSSPDQVLDLAKLAPTGTLYLRGSKYSGDLPEIPFADWKRITETRYREFKGRKRHIQLP